MHAREHSTVTQSAPLLAVDWRLEMVTRVRVQALVRVQARTEIQKGLNKQNL